MWSPYPTTVAVQCNTYVQCHMHICSGPYANNVEYMHTSVSGHIVDCSDLYEAYILTYLCMNTLEYMAYMWHFCGILIVCTHIVLTYFLSCDTDNAINDTIAFVMLR